MAKKMAPPAPRAKSAPPRSTNRANASIVSKMLAGKGISNGTQMGKPSRKVC